MVSCFFSSREKMAQAYDFALEKMGMDINSYQIWNDYVKFLKGVDAVGNYAENQKISAIRKVYQKGIVNPMVHIEQFWYGEHSHKQTIFKTKSKSNHPLFHFEVKLNPDPRFPAIQIFSDYFSKSRVDFFLFFFLLIPFLFSL